MIDTKKLTASVGQTHETARLIAHLLIERERSDEDWHQCIMNLGYNEWNRCEENKKWSHVDMLEWVEKTYGAFARLMIQLGNYNYQVCNGGHRQYYDNGYASNGGGCFTDHEESTDLHDWMLEKYEEIIAPCLSSATMDSFRILMKKFRVELDDDRSHTETCEECDGRGFISGEWDDETESYGEEEECPHCVRGEVDVDNENYNCPVNTHEWDAMDSEYYSYDKEVMATIGDVVSEALSLPKIKEDVEV